MKRLVLRPLAGALLAAACLVATPVAVPAAVPAAAPQSGPVRCVPFGATGIGQDLGGGQTTATIFVDGVRVGTTTAAFTITGVSGSLASFEGPLTFRPDGVSGTLVAQLVGTVDLVTGRFVAASESLTGTTRLAPVTGDVRIEGVQDLATGAFTETLDGQLCGPGRR